MAEAGMAQDQRYDVVVVGGGAAGLSAALMLGRSRRSVLVVDAGEPRNAPAEGVHGFLTRDGTPPGELLALARDEVRRYGVEVRTGRAVRAVRTDGGFRVELEDDVPLGARRLVLTTGVVDELPDVAGLAERWGRDVIHCPYCHGWEVRDRVVGVLSTSDAALHQAKLFQQLSDRVVVFSHTGPEIAGPDAADLAAVGVEVVDGVVVGLEVRDDTLAGVRLADGREVAVGALAVAPRSVGRSGLLDDLGVPLEESAVGRMVHVATDAVGRTAVAGVWAAGNLADPMAQVVQAAAQGAQVGARLNADLVDEDIARARARAAVDETTFWDGHYTGGGDDSPRWSGAVNPALVAEAADLVPGTALDVGCGEGADAVWLARRGWRVTGIDPSGVALARARRAADATGVAVQWVQAGLLGVPGGTGTHDLVSAQYAALPQDHAGAVLRTLLGAVAPGGTLLVVHHAGAHDGHDDGDGVGHSDGVGHGHGDGEAGAGGFDPDHYVLPDDVAEAVAALGDAWEVVTHGERPRPRPGPGAPEVPDIVFRAHRRG